MIIRREEGKTGRKKGGKEERRDGWTAGMTQGWKDEGTTEGRGRK